MLEPKSSAAGRYEEQWSLLWRTLASRWARLLNCREEALLAQWWCLTPAQQRVLGRWLNRRQGRLDAADRSAARRLQLDVHAGGWLDVDATQLSETAWTLKELAILAAFGPQAEDASWLLRLRLQQFRLPAGSPAQAWAEAGHLPTLAAVYDSRQQLEEFLCARRLRRAAADSDPALAAEIAQRLLAPLQGTALPLLYTSFSAGHQLTRLAVEAAGRLPASDPQRQAVLALLERCPCAPTVVGEATGLRFRSAENRQAVAETVCAWPIWRDGEAWRWRLRASGGRRRGAAPPWPERQAEAWLDRSGDRVVAEGAGVETHVLRLLRDEGWEGLHVEGACWWQLAILFCYDVLMQVPLPAASAHAVLPADWGQLGMRTRRGAGLHQRLRAIATDPLTALKNSPLAHELVAGSTPLSELGRLPPRELVEAICRSLPGPSLARLLGRLLDRPRDASGLPDLVVWRAGAVHLWEVKSPGDALSDRQRAWLYWCCCNDLPAGVFHLRERRIAQQRFCADAPAAPTAVARRPARARRSPAARAEQADRQARSLLCGLHLRGSDTTLPIAPGAALPASFGADAHWSLRPCQLPAALAELATSGNPWRWRPLALAHIGLQSGRAPHRRQHWLPLPDTCSLLAVSRSEAAPSGGLRTAWAIPLRPAGWLWPQSQHRHEPLVVASAAAVGLAESLCDDDQAVPPPPAEAVPPARWPELASPAVLAELPGCLDLLGADRDIVIDLRPDRSPSLAFDDAVLWTAQYLQARPLPFRSAAAAALR